VTRASFKSILVIGALQGVLVGLGLQACGLSGAAFWATITFVLSAVPGLGAPLVWVPASVYLMLTDQLAWGIALAAWGAIVVGSVDNMLRPMLVGRDTKLPDLVVLVSVPLSIFGAVVPIALGVVTLNIYTQIGLLTLIGLISKHGILIVEFANQLTARGTDRRTAVLEAAALRLRPILMTTFATVLGVLPLLLASGAGANARFGIGLMIAAGMLVGTLFTLFVLPVFYLPFRRHAHSVENGHRLASVEGSHP